MGSKKSLLAQKIPLASPKLQMDWLSGKRFQETELPTFTQKLKEGTHFPLKPKKLDIFQINVGYMCNQVCAHCHVDAGPDRREIMTKETMELCLEVYKKSGATTLDLTGGAPEMNPHFRWFVEEASKIGVQDFIVRSNLTILRAAPRYHDMPAFFKKHNIHVVSSLPFYKKGKTDKQRGDGVFQASIEALKELNKVGYGKEGSGLQLDLVYNPAGAFLPADQGELENQFKKSLKEDFGIEFNSLFAITNLPVSRFLEYLIRSENYEDYMETLIEAYNPSAVENVMCTNTLSVSWDGFLYDCDFNQMLDLKVATKTSKHLKDFNLKELENRNIIVNQHCYGCTAGAGSSCQGTVI
ncbi:MAG: arsenosugar biosynthesis radical SAM protein ArsS [Flavobacteriales bacterium]|jgi:radical SAM/Cys-rich protein|nr:arsenosugar biosynthesis radical SAM protein ArsS [Flavobacteriales bacterium]